MVNVLRRMSTGNIASLFALALFCFVLSGVAQATILIPPQTAPPTLLSCAGATCPTLASAGAVAGGSFTAVGGAYTANYITGVYVDHDPTNPIAGCAAAGNCLDFAYQVTDLTGNPIGKIVGSDFSGFTTDAVYMTNGSVLTGTAGGVSFVNGTVQPQLAVRNIPATVSFQFDTPTPGGIPNGATSLVVVVRTNATAFRPGTVSFIDGGTTTCPSTPGTNCPTGAFQPAQAGGVPEPASFVLMGGGLLALAGIRRFRRQ